MTLKLLCFEPRQTEKNAKKIFQSSRKCHQICTFWGKKIFFLAFSQIIKLNDFPKHLKMLFKHLPQLFREDYV